MKGLKRFVRKTGASLDRGCESDVVKAGYDAGCSLLKLRQSGVVHREGPLDPTLKDILKARGYNPDEIKEALARTRAEEVSQRIREERYRR